VGRRGARDIALAAPRATRIVAGIYVAETISDVLQLAYRAAEDQV
jgi:hypothetical protein